MSDLSDPSPLPQTEVLVLMAVGPNERMEDVDDSLNAAIKYLGENSCRILILDDTLGGTLVASPPSHPNVEVLRSPSFESEWETSRPKYGNLTASILFGLGYAVKRYHFHVLLKLDVDALVIGRRPQHELMRFFETNPRVGLVGAHRVRGDGTSKISAILAKGTELRQDLNDACKSGANPKFADLLLQFMTLARLNGYLDGDTVTGGAYALRHSCAKAIASINFDSLALFRFSRVAEDSIVCLCAYYLGFEASDLPSDMNVFAVNWRNLPIALGRENRLKTKIIHPIRNDKIYSEREIREYFARIRSVEP